MFDFSQLKQAPFGIQQEYTFYQDFQIADIVGKEKDIRSTYIRCKSWRSTPKAWGELVCALNWRIWDLYETNEPIAKVYQELYEDALNIGHNLSETDENYAKIFLAVID